jgi:hypothetical protein
LLFRNTPTSLVVIHFYFCNSEKNSDTSNDDDDDDDENDDENDEKVDSDVDIEQNAADTSSADSHQHHSTTSR